MAHDDGVISLDVWQVDGCAAFGAREQTCRWKCGSQCAHEAPNEGAVENDTFRDVVERFISRRGLLRGAAAVGVGLVVSRELSGGAASARAAQGGGSTLTFQSIPLDTTDRITVAPGYTSKVLLRWGDPLFMDSPPFNPFTQSAEAQSRQFGYNCDFVGFYPNPAGSDGKARALLVVNHEYTNPEIMFFGYDAKSPTRVQVDVELAAHGIAVVEIERRDREWFVLAGAPLNRRLTAESEMLLTGPAAGADWLKTSADATGTIVRGMLNNCSAGKTPWGTVLTCEENFNQYFANRGQLPDSDPRKAVHTRYGLPAEASERKWENFHDRFDISKEPNEPFRFGWVVEIDPYDPSSIPRKRTALGRFKHEATATVVGPDGRVGVYMGDDERFDFIYKFVSNGQADLVNRAANRDLLDSGTLYVAKFNDDGSGAWLPLIQGQGPLTAANGFANQADVLIKTRLAGTQMGATRMDRPEDIDYNPVNGKVYIALTNNTQRTDAQVDAPNPRANNRNGHIIELTDANSDPTATAFAWEIFMLCGDPAKDADVYFAGYPKELVSAISSPDNLVVDKSGNLWIFTDGQIGSGTLRMNDSVHVVPTAGPERGRLMTFLNGVPGGEVASGDLSDDDEALFVSIQHPGEGGTLEKPVSRWPDNSSLPRPSVVVAWKTAEGSKVIGS